MLPKEEPAQVQQPQFINLTRWIGVFLKASIGLGALLLYIGGNYQAAFESLIIMLVTFLPIMMARYFHIRIPLEFDTLAVIFIYMSLFLGEVQDFYIRFWWWDLVLHAGSGFLVGIAGFLLVYVMNQNKRIDMHLTPKFIALFAFMFSQGFGSLWEIFEFAMDSFFGLNMQKSGLVDTMWDLIVNALSALAISFMGYGYLKTSGDDSFLEQVIKKFIVANPRIFRKRRSR
ncbi:MAG: hypothetical protein V4628_07240 [Pseudomonadota bacterium]